MRICMCVYTFMADQLVIPSPVTMLCYTPCDYGQNVAFALAMLQISAIRSPDHADISTLLSSTSRDAHETDFKTSCLLLSSPRTSMTGVCTSGQVIGLPPAMSSPPTAGLLASSQIPFEPLVIVGLFLALRFQFFDESQCDERVGSAQPIARPPKSLRQPCSSLLRSCPASWLSLWVKANRGSNARPPTSLRLRKARIQRTSALRGLKFARSKNRMSLCSIKLEPC